MTEPMYRQIADDLRGKIESGELPQGSQLPTEIELIERYNASRNTIRDAIKVLINQRLVEPKPGQGTFVTEKIRPFVTTLTGDPKTGRAGVYHRVYVDEVEAEGRVPDASTPRVEIHRASSVVADALRIQENSQVISRHQERFIDGIPWSLQTTFYPMSLVTEHGATRLLDVEDVEVGIVTYLSKQCGINQTGYRDSIAVRTPDVNEILFFKLPADGRVSVFEIFRVGFDEHGGRFRLTVTVYPSDRNRFLVNVGEVPPRTARADGTA